jgi:hypothetical protein
MKAVAWLVGTVVVLCVVIYALESISLLQRQVKMLEVRLEDRTRLLDMRTTQQEERATTFRGLLDQVAKNETELANLLYRLTKVVTTLKDRVLEHVTSDWTHGTFRADTNAATVWLTNSTPPVRRYFPPLGDTNWHSHVIELGVDADGGTK